MSIESTIQYLLSLTEEQRNSTSKEASIFMSEEFELDLTKLEIIEADKLNDDDIFFVENCRYPFFTNKRRTLLCGNYFHIEIPHLKPKDLVIRVNKISSITL